jgi:hypothetical protein
MLLYNAKLQIFPFRALVPALVPVALKVFYFLLKVDWEAEDIDADL